MKTIRNPIEEYFSEQEASKEVQTSKELFKADKDVDIKTDLIWREITLITKLFYNDEILKKHKLKPVFSRFINPYLRLKISMDRKSRTEFVTMNKGETSTKDIIKEMSDVSNIISVKK